MKTKTFITKTGVIIGIALVFLLTNSCEKVKDISGDSGLKIISKLDQKSHVYFDDDLIGKLDPRGNETWDVPSGNHKLKVTGGTLGLDEEDIYFPPGQIVTLTIEETSKSSNTESSKKEYSIKYN